MSPLRAALCLLLGITLSACSLLAGKPVATPDFAVYRAQTRTLLAERRNFQTASPAQELEWNSPQEWRPAGRARRGILLVHGLSDSPWSFSDLGPALAARGYLVRTVLLPGHGTRPHDLMTVSMGDWRRVLREQAAALSAEVEHLYLGGFSTGANLVTEYALQHPEVAGLLLFSPAFKSDNGLDWLTPWISWARPWLREPDDSRPLQTPVRYLNTPTHGFGLFYRSSAAVRSGLAARGFSRPVLMVVAAGDSVLDVAFLRQSFSRHFTHPQSRLLWYGEPPAPAVDDARVLVRSDRLPEWRISQFSHMGLLFSPGNPLYGRDGTLRLCWNGQDEAARQRCEAGEDVWYSDWGYREPGKAHARLTFNPYFDEQLHLISQVFGSVPASLLAGQPSRERLP